MSAETTFNATLKAAVAVTAIVGAGDDARIYPDIVGQEVDLPCVAYTRTATEVTSTLSRPATDLRATLEVFCMAGSRLAAEALADEVVTAAGAAWFVLTSRRADYDDEQRLFAAVLSFDYWE